MLEIKEIWKTFNAGTVNEKQALRGVRLILNEGDFCTVIGGNGAGKSTMLNAVAGTWAVDAGTRSLRIWPWRPAGASGGDFGGALPRRRRTGTRSCSAVWAWGWRTVSPARWVSSPEASARR